MTITVEPTTKIVHVNGLPARIWEGVTDQGTPCHLYVTLVAVAEGLNPVAFEHELESRRAPSPEVEALPSRLVL